MDLPNDAPPWMQWAWKELGTHEQGDNSGPAIQRYVNLAHCGAQGEPWCAIFANAAIETAGLLGSRSPSSQSFRTNSNFLKLNGAALGALAVFWRGSHDSGLGHVGFYRGEDATHVYVLGGNENDQVEVEALPKQSATFGLLGYWWPKTVKLPAIAPVAMSSDTPHTQTKVV